MSATIIDAAGDSAPVAPDLIDRLDGLSHASPLPTLGARQAEVRARTSVAIFAWANRQMKECRR